ncbi:ABC transporter permease [Bradyrhizobium diazoefficiens]
MSDLVKSDEGRLKGQLYANGLVAVALLAWWLTSQSFPATFPGLGAVSRSIADLTISAEFWSSVGITSLRIGAAVLLATLIGSFVGLLPRYVPWAGGIVDDILVPFFSSFPGIAWAILGTIWFGINSGAVLIVQVLIILPFSLVNVAEGAKAIGIEEIEMGRSFSRRVWSLFWRIELPLLSPFIMTSVRLSYGVCWKVSLIAELFGAHSGIGYLMQLSQDLAQVSRIVAICLWIVFFVVVGERLVLDPLSRLLIKGERSGRRKTKTTSFLSRE